MTPGTATIRRKSVSFGHDVKEQDAAARREGRRNGRSRPTRSASLNRALEIAKDEKSGQDNQTKPLDTKLSMSLDIGAGKLALQPVTSRRKESDYLTKPDLLEELARDDPDGDMTMDLNQPHSQSGRYWKSEFQKYHTEAQHQMKILLTYKEGAKDFARMKDVEVLELQQQLTEAVRKKTVAENKMSSSLRRKARALGYDSDEDVDISRLLEDLARKTALCEQYKKQVENLRCGSESIAGRERKNLISQDKLTMTTKKESSPHIELLREEILHLQDTLRKAEKDNTRLTSENKQLKEDVAHSELKYERQAEKFEKRRESFDDVRRKKEDALEELQKTYDQLKENAKAQRRDAEQLLKKRYDQSVELKKELAIAREFQSKIKDLESRLLRQREEHSEAVVQYEVQIAELKRDIVLGTGTNADLQASIARDPHLSKSFAKHVESPARPRESQIPRAFNSNSRPVKATNRHTWSETPASSPPKKEPLPLSEIINKANPATVPPVQSGPVQFTPAAHRFSDLAMPNPDFELPSSEPSIEITLPAHKQRISPRPAFVHIASSPPKISKIPVHDNKDRFESRERQASNGSGKSIDSSRIRREVAPERAAAAKARLEQKMAEKRKAQAAATGKENVFL